MKASALEAVHPSGTTWVERDGIRVPARCGRFEDEVAALRRSVTLSDLGHTSLVRVAGPQAWDVLDRLLPCDLFLRSGQARQTLLLAEDGTVRADVLVVCDDQAYLLFAEGLPAASVFGLVHGAIAPGEEVEVEDLGAGRTLVGVNGPFAWELLSEVWSPGIAGMPYLTLAELEGDVLCVRAGKTGEYGYDLMVPRSGAVATWRRLEAAGSALDARPIGQETLRYAALENWFFHVYEAGLRRLSPLHLQLQWRVSRHKEYPGSAALRALREGGIARRVTALRGPETLAVGQPLLHRGRPVGEMVAASRCWTGPGGIGLGLIDLALAHPGHDRLSVATGDGTEPVRTVSPPFITNRSLVVRPQWHRYATRDQIPFPE